MKNTGNHCSFPIDLVYLWVDGNDAAWREKKNLYSGNASVAALSEARFRSNDELKYSLRSVEKYAPWVNRIFIVTDNQCPEWLDATNPKVQIIDHSQIFPAEALPVFNSTAIEAVLHRIPGLGEHFIVGNDDTVFTAPVTPGDFFCEDGRPIVRLSARVFDRKKAMRKDVYRRMLVRMQDIVQGAHGVLVPHTPHHNFDAYCKSTYKQCLEGLGEMWNATVHNRFRRDSDIHRSVVAYFMVATNCGVLRRVGRYNRTGGFCSSVKAFLTGRFASDSRTVPVSAKDYKAIMRKYNPLMLCVNDDERATDDDCRRMVAFLEELFPAKSTFER